MSHRRVRRVIEALAVVVWMWAAGIAIVSAWVALEPLRARGVHDSHPRLAARRTVHLLRPCAGLDPWLERTLASTALLRSTLHPATRFVLHDHRDPAAPAAHAAASVMVAHGLDARVVYSAAEGPNHKCDQLARALPEALGPDDIVVVIDADIDLETFDLDALVAPLDDPACGASWAPVYERALHPTVGDRASAAVLGASLQCFSLVARLDGASLVGKLFALRADVLVATGGFVSLVHHLGEDMEIARRVRALGLRVHCTRVPVRSSVVGRSLANTVARFARWMLVIRLQRPLLLAAYPLLFAPLVPFAVLCAVPLVAHRGHVGGALVLVVLARLAVTLLARRATGHGMHSPLDLLVETLLAEFVLLCAFVRVCSMREVRWRDRVLTFDAAGRLRSTPRPV